MMYTDTWRQVGVWPNPITRRDWIHQPLTPSHMTKTRITKTDRRRAKEWLAEYLIQATIGAVLILTYIHFGFPAK